MSTPNFADFGKPAASDKAGMVVCLDCRKEKTKAQTRFVPRECGYLCHACVGIRRNKFLAKVGSVIAGMMGVILWILWRFGKFQPE